VVDFYLGVTMADYTELQWRKKYRPTINPSNGYDSYSPGEEEIVLKNPVQNIWTEIWDWEEEAPLLASGFFTEEQGAISWYICEVPWEGDAQLLAEKAED
jgi:hypothetical protein